MNSFRASLALCALNSDCMYMGELQFDSDLLINSMSTIEMYCYLQLQGLLTEW